MNTAQIEAARRIAWNCRIPKARLYRVEHLYVCKLTLSSKTYRGYGYTELEAYIAMKYQLLILTSIDYERLVFIQQYEKKQVVL